MPLTVIVGGQFGSEGKGKLCAYLSLRNDVDAVIRCGSTNSGHTVVIDGDTWKLRMIPSGFVNPRAKLMLPAGSLIDPQILAKEVQETRVTPDRLIIDKNAGIIELSDIVSETQLDLVGQFGSTQSGVGHALSRRIMRRPEFRLAQDVVELRELATIGDVSAEIDSLLRREKKVIVEGTQGYGLSIYHTHQFPYATSRDTTAASFLAEVGVSPLRVDEIVLAIRTFPIRVGGRSGPLENEITWEKVRELSGYPYDISEYTTATNRLRRVAMFDISTVKRAVMMNGATKIALHGADYLSYENRAVNQVEDLNPAALSFITWLEQNLAVPVEYVGTGPDQQEMVHRQVSATQRR